MSTVLIVPGLNSSGPGHWQTWLEEMLGTAQRVEQSDWASPHLSHWADRLRAKVCHTPGRFLLVAHSFGCLATAAAARELAGKVVGALLVAPADPVHFGAHAEMPRAQLPFPTRVVASRNDHWMSYAEAARWAQTWSADLVDAGYVGHINVQSGHGAWPQVFEHLEKLDASVQRYVESQVVRGQAEAGSSSLPVREHLQLR